MNAASRALFPAPPTRSAMQVAVEAWKPAHAAYRVALRDDLPDDVAEDRLRELTARLLVVVRAAVASPADVRLRMAVLLSEIGRPSYVDAELESALANGGVDVVALALCLARDLLRHRRELMCLPDDGPIADIGEVSDGLQAVRRRLLHALTIVDDVLGCAHG